MPDVRSRFAVSGYAAAAAAVLIWASYPVATRAGVSGTFAPHDLILLRFGVGALLLLPWVMLHFRAISRDAWLRGIPLTLFQGAGMAALVISGLQFAPASHAAALGPGVAPAWVALLGFLLFARRPSARVIAGASLCAIGVIVLATWTASAAHPDVLAGDAMFLAASALGALYVLQLRKWGIGALQGAAIVTIYSALAVVPWHLWSASSGLWQVAPFELLWQVLWQGVLIGCIALVALNHAIARLGPERSSALVALVPALSAVLGLLFLGERLSGAEIAAILTISAGVSIGASRQRDANPPIAAVPRPAMRQRSAVPAGYPGPDSAA
jgi:drug/metabolite transporter (DMT)-like permease